MVVTSYSSALRNQFGSAADGLVTAGERYLLREADVRYLCYLPTGGSVTLNLAETTGTLTYGWFNPRTGATVAGGTVSGGGSRTFTARWQ